MSQTPNSNPEPRRKGTAATPTPAKPVDRLFPVVLRTGILMVGREKIWNNRNKLHFVLITKDISEATRDEILKNFLNYPVVQYFMAADLERFFGVTGAKTVGFTKSGLAQSIYGELKPYRLNKPAPSAPSPPGK